MSVNWHYFRVIGLSGDVVRRANNTSLVLRAAQGSSKDLEAFTGYMVDQRENVQTGRAWKATELRLKSHDDLHKLWYVLLKERNKLKSDWLMCKQLQQIFSGESNLVKVNLSMKRLLTVVNERKRLRNQYR